MQPLVQPSTAEVPSERFISATYTARRAAHVPGRLGNVVKTEKAKYITRYDASRFAALLDANPKLLNSVSSLAIDYMNGATAYVQTAAPLTQPEIRTRGAPPAPLSAM